MTGPKVARSSKPGEGLKGTLVVEGEGFVR